MHPLPPLSPLIFFTPLIFAVVECYHGATYADILKASYFGAERAKEKMHIEIDASKMELHQEREGTECPSKGKARGCEIGSLNEQWAKKMSGGESKEADMEKHLK